MYELNIKKKYIGVFVYVQPTIEIDLTKRINLCIYHVQ
jgi:hypothetical protein